MTMNVGIYLFPEVEVLDFAGPYEVFTTASRVQAGRDGKRPFAVFTVGRQQHPVKARAGLSVLVDHALSAHPPIDVLFVPGGVIIGEMASDELMAWLHATASKAQVCAAVCTGAFLLAKAGLLEGRQATTHWEDLAQLQENFPGLTAVAGRRWIDLGRIVTSGGISAGIDMSLHLVERLAGRKLARATARQMEYRWLDDEGVITN
jgi:transcriptional regulator GlxA family with amidase domain